MRRPARLVTLALAGLTLLSACVESGSKGSQQQTLTVLAASSLTGTFETLATRFEEDHPGVDVTVVADSSATLAQHVQEGAPADVLATADLATMKKVLDSGDADTSSTFATNELVLVTPAGNPAGIESMADLDAAAVSFVACVETAPCGKVAAQLLDEGHIGNEPKSLEVDVKAVLAKVVADEADAGLVYATDAEAAAGDVLTFPVPGSAAVPNTYAIAVVDQSEASGLAQAWVDLVLSAAGQEVFAAAGFLPAS